MYGNEPQFNEFVVITNTIHTRKRTKYLDITNKCESVIRGSDWGGGGPLVGCRLKFSYFVGSRLKFSIFVGSRLNFLIFVGCPKISVNK